MEIRNVKISFAEGLEASLFRKHGREVKERLDKLNKKSAKFQNTLPHVSI